MPSLREKKRYIVFQVETNKEKEMIFKNIEKTLKEFLGILGMSKVNPVILKEKFKNNKGIIRINNPYKDEVITALSMIEEFKVRVIGVSGILKKAEEKYMVKKGGE